MGPPPPFESVWREDRLIGESTLAVIKAYVEAGFADIEPEAGPQDHIGVELKFLSLLALREAEAWKSGNDEMARKRVAQQQKFLQQHLGLWAPRWADSIIEQSREPLYAALAGLLKAGLAETQFELSSLLKQAA
jgi:TorA maturation chaperone TorD